jgi:ferrous iron transport protein B
MHPVKGLAVLAVILAAVFWFVGLLGAGTLVDLLETGVFGHHLNPLAIRAADAILPFPHTHETEALEAVVALPLTAGPRAGRELGREALVPGYRLEPGLAAALHRPGLGGGPHRLAGAVPASSTTSWSAEYGVVTMALSYALAIVLPIVTTFFLLFSVLEDSGYLPRMSIMVNRLFRVMGLNGKAVLPMILGLGCDTMATMTTRVLETRKERVVTTMLLALAVPCSAQLGVLLAMMAALSPAASSPGWG